MSVKDAASAPAAAAPEVAELAATLRHTLDDAKAEDIALIDLAGKTSLADCMLIATGRSDRHVGAIAERVIGTLRELKRAAPRVEGMPVCDWVLIDAGDIILHLFRPEVRGFYNLEKLWGVSRPQEDASAAAEKPRRPRRIRTAKAE